MGLELKQSLRLSQQLVMTPQLQQAIKLLQLNRLELVDAIRAEIEQNPLLEEGAEGSDVELSEAAAEHTSTLNESIEASEFLPEASPDKTLDATTASQDVQRTDIDWEQYLDNYQTQHTAPSAGGVSSDDMPSFESLLTKAEGLAEHLLEQLRLLPFNDDERRIAQLIIFNLDKDGYLSLDADAEPEPEPEPRGDADIEADAHAAAALSGLGGAAAPIEVPAVATKSEPAREVPAARLAEVPALATRLGSPSSGQVGALRTGGRGLSYAAEVPAVATASHATPAVALPGWPSVAGAREVAALGSASATPALASVAEPATPAPAVPAAPVAPATPAKLGRSAGDPLLALALDAGVSATLAEKVLKRIQLLDPIGCACRDLRESLLVQAQWFLRYGDGKDDPDAELLPVIIRKHLKNVESKKYQPIAKDLKVSLEEVVATIKLLSVLEPKPGRFYSGEEPRYITPDVYIHKVGDGYMTVLNDDGLSKLRISNHYRNALKNGGAPGATGAKTKEYIQEKLRSAVWLIRSIHQRQRTIVKVADSIIKFQRDFLDKGIAHLKPLILRDVAEDIGMHESTVSRVTTNKYVHTPQGIYELKFFFNSSIARVGGEDIASEAVKNQIKQVIAKEPADKPYSDQKIVEILRSQNVDIARRTVAKYREVLGILPSSKRKRYF